MNTKITYIYGHTNQETAKVVENYPWGFRLRTTIRYWIETKVAKNGGQRFASQTINPKTGLWCAPKYSTYSPIMIMFLDENDHVKYECLRHYDSQQNILKFKEDHLENLDDYQKQELKGIMAYAKVMENVSFTVKAVSPGSVDHELREQEQNESLRKINRAIGYEMSKITL